MKWSLNLGRIFGIKIKVHWTFFILIFWIVFSEVGRGSNTPSIIWNVLLVLTVFLCVVFHELGHALMARRFGVVTKRITLLPIGGVASLERMPEKPKQEFLVAIAGPLVNVAIAIIIFPLLGNLHQYIPQNQDQMMQAAINGNNFMFYLFSVNVILVIFNLIPAFPMDGGRILRALLAFNMNRMKATQIAANIGKFLAFVFFVFGLFFNPWLALIGVFVYFGAHSENIITQQMELLRDHIVQEAMMTKFESLQPEETVEEAKNKLLQGEAQVFLIMEENNVVGLLPRMNIIEALRQHQGNSQVKDVMLTDYETIKPSENLARIFMHILGKKQPIFPVVNDGQLLGAIDRENINEFLMVQSALKF